MSDNRNKPPEEPTPAPPVEAKKKVTLRVASAHVHSFSLPREGADTLVVTKRGEEFSVEDAVALVEAAGPSGVTLTEVSE